MNISELIKNLEDASNTYSDIPVTICVTPSTEGFEEYSVISTEADEKSITLYNF